MIRIRITQGKRKEITIDAKGHADYNPGNDIVCSGVSALLQAMQGYLMYASKSFEVDARSGFMHMEYKGHIEATKMLIIGLLRIQKAYPDNVNVEYDVNFLH